MRRKLAIAFAVGAIVLFLTRGWWLGALGRYLVQEQPPQKADLGIVLAGDARGGRILKGSELVRQGFVPKLLVSGPDGMYGSHECDLEIPFAVRAGYPESYYVHFESTARSTRDEAQQAAQVLRKMGVHRLLLVTSNFHTRRAGRIFREAMPDIDVTVVASDDPYFSPDGWWKNREGQKTALYEWLKTVTSWVNL